MRTFVINVLGIVLLGSGLSGCSVFSSMFKQTPSDPLALEVKQQQAEVKRLQTTADSLTSNRIRLWDDIQTLRILQTMTPDQIIALTGKTDLEMPTQDQASGQPSAQQPVQETEKKGILGSVTGVFGKIGNGIKKIGGGLKKLWPF